MIGGTGMSTVCDRNWSRLCYLLQKTSIFIWW